MARRCIIDGCDRPGDGRLCPMHYARLRCTGSLDVRFPHGDPLVRLMKRVRKDPGGCWTYLGTAEKHGYAVITEGDRGWYYGHRLAYERLVGPIPPGHRLHHLCENGRCVNPAHLRPVTAAGHARAHGLAVGPCR